MTDESFTEEFETAVQANVERSAIRNLRAGTAQIQQSAVQRLTAETVNAHNSAMGAVSASTVELRQGAAGMIAGDYVRVEESSVFVLLAPRVSGNVRAFVTLPMCFAFGAGYFLTRSMANAVFGRRNR